MSLSKIKKFMFGNREREAASDKLDEALTDVERLAVKVEDKLDTILTEDGETTDKMRVLVKRMRAAQFKD